MPQSQQSSKLVLGLHHSQVMIQVHCDFACHQHWDLPPHGLEVMTASLAMLIRLSAVHTCTAFTKQPSA